MSNTSVSRFRAVAARPADEYAEFGSEPFPLRALVDVDRDELVRQFGVNPEVVEILRSGRATDVLREHPDLIPDARLVYARTSLEEERPVHISRVSAKGPIWSGTPFTLLVEFQNAADARVVVASVEVSWAGDPFVVEAEVQARGDDDLATIEFDEEQTLPVGPAEFVVTLAREDGATSVYRWGAYVLPANPLALSLGPAGARVTGSWSARGDYLPASDTFLTEVEFTISNGDARAVSMNRRVTWEFWDGAVGAGRRVESGSFDWSGISVSAFGVWRGTAWFSSPRGSGIFDTYARKEDMAISITMSASDGRVLNAQITARVMLAYGVNIIKVGTFSSSEHTDLYAAVDQMRQIYERRDITLRGVDRRLIDAATAGAYTITNSEDEFRDMLEDWSCRNDFVDVFVVQDFQWSGFNGYAGDIPGPASKGGRKDGVAVEKTGYTDASGAARLDVATLAQLIGHEVGHYLGLEHLETTNNLMRSNTGVRGPDLDYNQYRTMFPHGYVVFE
ncbi:zinc metalloprotease [Agromyces humi]|uniref:hypothetical protein n=1 Tax=Agromyces humi TaxID=1766800 RepID=UPI001358AC50|nr:hypothetical protein [Agromyces humi]